MRERLFSFYGWLFLGIISLPIYFTFKNGYGDLLYLDELFIDLFVSGGKWSDWSFTPSPAFIPDIALYALSYFLFDYTMDRIFFVSIAQIVLIILSLEYLFRAFSKENHSMISVSLLMLLSVVSYCAYTTPMWMYFNSTNNHIGSYILGIVSLGLVLRILNAAKIRDYFFLFVINVAAIVSGAIYIITFLATAGITLLIFLLFAFVYRAEKKFILRLVLILLILVSGYFVAQHVTQLINPHGVLHFAITHQGMINAASHLLPQLYDQITTINPYFIFFNITWAIGVALSVLWFGKQVINLYLEHYHIKNQAKDTRGLPGMLPENINQANVTLIFLLAFTLMLIPVNTLGVVVSGGIHNHGGLRYFMLAISLPIFSVLLFLFLYFKDYVEHVYIKLGVMAGGLIVLVTFISSFDQQMMRLKSAYITPWETYKFDSSFDIPLSIDDVRQHKYMSDKNLAECLDEHKEQYGLEYGVAEFWDARSVRLLSEKGIWVAQVNANFYPQFWRLNSKAEYRTGDNVFYNFIVTSTRYPAHLARTYAGTETSMFTCHNTDEKNQILVFAPGTGFNNKVQAVFNEFHNRFR